ncbi:hypothetical protein [Taklimakanibacter lacteus]|uniref:hypothetical protein n=1 Tax=Taklimakanibacter lacteus TaxID=2268456 RepID=UPI000E66A9D8
MLDYRAHKLYWLLLVPLALAAIALSFLLLFAVFVYARTFSYPTIVQFGIAVALFELGMIALQILFAILSWAVRKIFFFVVDVEPAEGRNKIEAEAVLVGGNVVRYIMKLKYQPRRFDDDDEAALIRASKKSQGGIVRALRFFSGGEGSTLFTSTPRHRIEAIVDEVRTREHDRTSVARFIDSEAELYLRQRGMWPSGLEQFLMSQWGRYLVYRYSFLILFFAVGALFPKLM